MPARHPPVIASSVEAGGGIFKMIQEIPPDPPFQRGECRPKLMTLTLNCYGFSEILQRLIQ